MDAYDPITHEAITVTNDTYINQEVFCEFLEKIATAYADSERPITLILDNARYQKCQSVANKAKELNIGATCKIIQRQAGKLIKAPDKPVF